MTEKIRVCPKCGDPEIGEVSSSVKGWLVPTTYYCAKDGCDYSGPSFVELEKEEVEVFRRVINGEYTTTKG